MESFVEQKTEPNPSQNQFTQIIFNDKEEKVFQWVFVSIFPPTLNPRPTNDIHFTSIYFVLFLHFALMTGIICEKLIRMVMRGDDKVDEDVPAGGDDDDDEDGNFDGDRESKKRRTKV